MNILNVYVTHINHLHLRPGEDLIDELGGLHRFMNWNKPILTDSGGFQVFSLGLQKGKSMNKIDENGVTFKSHLDGSTKRLTPEISIDIQHKLGADIIMAFDECTPDKADKHYVLEAMARTHCWAERSLNAHQKNMGKHKQYLFGIIQGANNKELREESAQFICNLDFDGIAVGGESIGYNMEATKEILEWIAPYLPKDKPHYSMGVGLNPTDLFEVVERGIDMFDCVAPTRLARHGMVFLQDKEKKHRLNITNSKYIKDEKPIDPNCTCHTCHNYSKSYLNHLFKAKEISAMRLTTIHNIHFYMELMKKNEKSNQ